MKELFKTWRLYSKTPTLNEALEYDPKTKQDKPIDSSIAITPQIQQLMDKVSELDAASMRAYEQGLHGKATELDAQLADTQERLESAMSELGDKNEEHTGRSGEEGASRGTDMLMRRFASIYYHYAEGIPLQGLLMNREEAVEDLRTSAKAFSHDMGGFKGATDDELLDAARDSYERLKGFKDRYEQSTAGERKEALKLALKLNKELSVLRKEPEDPHLISIMKRMQLSELQRFIQSLRSELKNPH